jgi:hypothetical protein
MMLHRILIFDFNSVDVASKTSFITFGVPKLPSSSTYNVIKAGSSFEFSFVLANKHKSTHVGRKTNLLNTVVTIFHHWLAAWTKP